MGNEAVGFDGNRVAHTLYWNVKARQAVSSISALIFLPGRIGTSSPPSPHSPRRSCGQQKCRDPLPACVSLLEFVGRAFGMFDFDLHARAAVNKSPTFCKPL